MGITNVSVIPLHLKFSLPFSTLPNCSKGMTLCLAERWYFPQLRGSERFLLSACIMEASSQSSSQQILWKDVSPFISFWFMALKLTPPTILNKVHILFVITPISCYSSVRKNESTFKFLQLNKLSVGGRSSGLEVKNKFLWYLSARKICQKSAFFEGALFGLLLTDLSFLRIVIFSI